MKRNRILVFILALAVAMMMSIAVAEEAAPAEVVTLEAWNGAWNSALLYFEHDQVQQAFADISSMTGESKEATEAMFTGMFANEITSVIINAPTISFYDVMLDGAETDVEPVAVAEYKHMGTLDNGMHLFYSADEAAPYAYLGFYEKEEDEAGRTMTHFHSRYGASVGDLMTEAFWYPTFVPYGTEDIVIYNSFIEFVSEHAGGQGEAAEETAAE